MLAVDYATRTERRRKMDLNCLRTILARNWCLSQWFFAVNYDRIGKSHHFLTLDFFTDILQSCFVQGPLVPLLIPKPSRYVAGIKKSPNITDETEDWYILQVELDGLLFH